MTALIVIAAIFLLLAAVCLIPITIELKAGEGDFSFRLSLGWHTLLPSSKKKVSEKKAAEKKAPKAAKKKGHLVSSIKKLGFSLSDWLEVLKVVLKTIGRIVSGLKVQIFKLHLTISDNDPYNAVMKYNTAVSALCSILPYIDKTFKVKDREIALDTDFDAVKTRFSLHFKSFLRLGVLILAAITALFSILCIIIKHRIMTANERKAQNGEQTQRTYAVDNEQHQEHGGGQ